MESMSRFKRRNSYVAATHRNDNTLSSSDEISIYFNSFLKKKRSVRTKPKKKRKKTKHCSFSDGSLIVQNDPDQQTNLFYKEFLIENLKFMDSPIHLMWKYKQNDDCKANNIKVKKSDKRNIFSYLKDLISIFLSTITLFSSLFLFEMINILWQQSYFLIIFKMSFTLANIISIILILSSHKFLKAILSTPNFFLLIFQIIVLYLIVLCNLFFSYYTSKYKHDSQLIFQLQIFLAILFGFTLSLLILYVINFLCHFSDRSSTGMYKNYQNTFLCYLALYQTNILYSSIVFLISFHVIDKASIESLFCQMCSNFLNASVTSFCPYKRQEFVCLSTAKIDAATSISSNIYAIIFGLTAFNFLISLIFAFLYIFCKSGDTQTKDKSSNKVKGSLKEIKIIRISCFKECSVAGKYTFFSLYAMFPSIFFHGFIKTLLSYELAKVSVYEFKKEDSF